MKAFPGPCIRRSIIIFPLLVLWLSAIALANDYYVSPSGSDSNIGSQGGPWATIQHAVNSFSNDSNGTVIHVEAGAFASGITINRGGASKSSRLVLQCDPGLASATAAIGKCRISGSSTGIMITGNNIDVVGFDIGGNPNMNIGIVTVNQGSGVASTGGNSTHVIGNYIHDLAGNVSGPNGVGCPPQGAIQMQNQHGHTMTDQQVLRNLVLRYGSGSALPGCNQAHGIYTSAPDAVVQNNIVVGAPTSAIQTTAPCGNVISNNVMINAQAGLILENTDLVGCPGGVPGHNTIVNNYVGNTTWHIFTVGDAAACTASTPNLISHNVSDGLDTEYKAGPFSCDIANSWSHQAGSGFFVNYKTDGSGDYRPKSGSLAFKSGTTACTSGGISPCTPSVDFAGQSRSAAISVGPYDLLPPGGAPDAPTGLIVTVN